MKSVFSRLTSLVLFICVFNQMSAQNDNCKALSVVYRVGRPILVDGEQQIHSDSMELISGKGVSIWMAWNRDLLMSSFKQEQKNLQREGTTVVTLYSYSSFEQRLRDNNDDNALNNIKSWDAGFTTEMLYKTTGSNEITYYDELPGMVIGTTREITPVPWNIVADTMTVLGYPCHKATAFWGGRTWTAWYSEEIAVSDGPSVFSGLPGLILQMENADKSFSFEAIGIQQHTIPCEKLKLPENYRKVTHKEFIEFQEKHRRDRQSYAVGKDGVLYKYYNDNNVVVVPLEKK